MRLSQSVFLFSTIAVFGSVSFAGNLPDVSNQVRHSPNFQYATACGPISCYTALRTVGVTSSIKQLALKCKWQPGKSVSMRAMQEALSSTEGVSSVPVRLSPGELWQYLKQKERVAAVLTVRKFSEDIDHSFAAIGLKDDRIVIVDYPGPIRTLTMDQLADIWDGQALLVSRENSKAGSVLISGRIALFLCGCVFTTIIVIFAAKRFCESMRKRANPKG